MNTIEGPIRFTGRIGAAGGIDLPAGSITPAHIDADPDDPITAEKVEQQISKLYSQPNTTATAVRQVLHIARGDGTLERFEAGSIAIAVGAATVTVDLQKNGVSVLSSVITLDSGNTARVAEAVTVFATATYSAGDCLEIVTTATAGGGTIPTGLFVQLTAREQAE